MSFEFNSSNNIPNNHLSGIQKSSKPSDGGAGNTGYFKREQKDTPALILKKEEYDSFGIKSIPEIEFEEYSFSKYLKRQYLKLLVKIRRFFRGKKSKK